MAVWNYAPPGQSGPAKTFTVHFQHIGAKSVTLWHLDADHGDYHRTYEQMGSPAYPTSTQVQQLREAAADSTPETLPLNNGELSITVPAPALIVMELK
jgi:xylan 1,4-beta-xylosidase